jgi:hypothetical protein
MILILILGMKEKDNINNIEENYMWSYFRIDAIGS